MRGPCKTALGDGVSSSHRCGSARVAAAIVQRPDLVKGAESYGFVKQKGQRFGRMQLVGFSLEEVVA